MPERTSKSRFHWYLLIPAVLILGGIVFAAVFFSSHAKVGNTWQKKSAEIVSLSDISSLDFNALQNLPNLKMLDLKNAVVSAEEARNIYASLPENINAEFYIPIGGKQYLNTEKDLDISSLNEGEEAYFDLFKNLEYLRFENSALIPGILNLPELLSGRDVSWSVDIGGMQVENNITSLDLSGRQFDSVDKLTQALKYLPNLKALVLDNTNLSNDEIEFIQMQFPDLSVESAVAVGDVTFPRNTEHLVLSGINLTVNDLIINLSSFPKLKSVDLHNCNYSAVDMQKLYEAYPDIEFEWTVYMYGQPQESTAEVLDLSGTRIEDNFAELKQNLPYFRNLKTVDVSFCGPSDEECDALNKSLPKVEIVWTVTVYGNKKYLVRTDATSFSTALSANSPYHISTKGSKALKYCTKIEALDVGHNNIHEIEFVEYMPNLRYLILAGCGVKDISALKNLEHLEYIELFINDITDLSPLSGKDSLLDLNIARNKITDLSPLYSCKNLERLWAAGNPLEKGQEEAIRERFPNTTFNFSGYSPTRDGWRKHERFYAMREAFGLPVID